MAKRKKIKKAASSPLKVPQDLKGLSSQALVDLAKAIRREIIRVVSRNGGHLASNLGVVELTIALHRVFATPKDQLVWDVGHQCYAHKLLTGRAASFGGLRRARGLSGFPKRSESPHDAFDTGHASTSVSAALGLLAGARLLGEKRHVVAVIGDGALTGGLAYEGLSHAGQLSLPLIVVLNDNKMSIGPNVGAISKYLSRLTMKYRYQLFRRTFDGLVRRLPIFGEAAFHLIVRMKRGLKALFYPENFFVDLGFEYVGPIDGHNMTLLEQVLTDVKKLDKPVVVHVMTKKGKGFSLAEDDPSAFHGVTGFSLSEGLFERRGPASFTEAFGQAMLELGREDKDLIAVCAAMEKGTGLSSFRQLFPARFFDVGIAEGHALTFAAGLAVQGLKPVVAIYSTFIQRAVDQLIHDIALQKLAVTLVLDRAGFVADDGETHQGLFDIALFRSVPNLCVLCPAAASELTAMLRWAIKAAVPVVIRYPKAACPPELTAYKAAIEPGRGVFIRKADSPVLLCSIGGLFPQVAEAADLLAFEGIKADIYNLRFVKPIDEDYLVKLLESYNLVVSVEEGFLSGGFGEYLAALIARRAPAVRTLTLGAGDWFPAQASREELLLGAGLSAHSIAGAVAKAFRQTGRLTVIRRSAQ